MFRKLLNSELNRITPEEFKLRKKMPVIVVLDNIRSQHNIGSAFRSCDAFLVEKLLLCGICAVPPTPEIHKSALGAEFSMEWEHFESTAEAVRRLKEEGYVIVSVEQTEHSTLLQDFRPAEGARYAFIFGNEVRGVQQEVVNMSNICLEIPQYGTKHSLNVSVSIGVVLWDVVSKFF
ncbi:MAG TPA: RNA methyltransferase [Bacteroidales bacterium]|jgi:23S rRNA (guanosine2251-2'-O)-methyltransferase|nr:RNA methyltransferase [Bacteroidales bacterium]HQA93756.1 RNA methyltransferase [Bacteroidales bacterium]